MSNYDRSLLPILREVFEAKLEYLNTALDTISSTYNSLDNFLINTLNIDIETLRNKFLR